MHIWLSDGKLDNLLTLNRAVHNQLLLSGIPHDYSEYEGVGHDLIQCLNDSVYGKALLHWQSSMLNKTCPVAIHNVPLPIHNNFPFVNEDNPVTGIPKYPDSRKSSTL